jgi:hypothetical protein
MLIFKTNYFTNEELSQKLGRIEIVMTVYVSLKSAQKFF